VEITITLNAPDLAGAIQALAAAMSPGSLKTSPVTQESKALEPGKPEGQTSVPNSATEAESTEPPETAPAFTLEEVRAKLAALSQAGKQDAVRGLIGFFGVKKLTDVPPERYGELMAMAEKI